MKGAGRCPEASSSSDSREVKSGEASASNRQAANQTDADIEVSKLVLRSSSGEEIGLETDGACIDKMLKVIGNYKQPAVKTEVEVKSEPMDSEGDTLSGRATKPCGGPNCYLPQTAFQKSGGSLLRVRELEAGSQVLATDGSETSVVSAVPLPFDLYSIVELVTRKGSCKVSECHRIAIPGQDGSQGDSRAAADLRVGDHVFFGSRNLPLTRISFFKMHTELYKVAFYPDVPVEAVIVPCGMHTHGQNVPYPPADFSVYSEADLLQAMPTHYED